MLFTVEAWPPPVKIRWPDPETGPWDVELRLEVVDGRVECVGISLQPTAEGPIRALRAKQLRSLNVAALVAGAKQHRRDEAISLIESVEAVDRDDEGWAGFVQHAVAEAEAEAVTYGRQGPQGRGGRPALYKHEHWEAVAEVYRAAAVDGAPTQAVANTWQISKSAAAKWISRARELNLLPPTSQGIVTLESRNKHELVRAVAHDSRDQAAAGPPGPKIARTNSSSTTR